ncbi:Type 1 glutamine amidotransferase-like domain-containing protein [Patescibacteria group bacterium]|nr:Type 1 glutamine amidotransferase-like domain-containing protein [Patescibacteria group bacterium]
MNKGYIILSGGGNIEMSFNLDEKYFSLLKNNTKILYIPIALNRTKIGFEACYDWFSTVISNHSGEKDIDFTMLFENDEIPDFETYDSIYIGGGNTYKLLDYIYRENVGKKIIDYIKRGGIFYGGSAGAIVLGKDIRTVEEENDNDYSCFNGLNLLGGQSVICHYEETFDEKIFKSVQKINSQIIALPENSGIIIGGNIVEMAGKAFIFGENNKKQILTSKFVSNLI